MRLLTFIAVGLIGLLGCQDPSQTSTLDEPHEVRLEEVSMNDDGEGDEAEAVEVSVGERRVRVDVDFHRALAGNIRPGDRVDILYMTNTTISPNQPEANEATSWKSILMLQNIVVLDVDASGAGDGDGSVKMSLSLTLNEAEIVLVGQAEGLLALTLRPETNRDNTRVRLITLENVLEDLDSMYHSRGERIDEAHSGDRGAPDESTPLAERIPYDERALTVVVPSFRTDKWRPKPGDRVDLSAIIDDENIFERISDDIPKHHHRYPMSLDLLAGVDVLAVAENRAENRAENQGDLLTVSLTPDEVQMLITFEMAGQISARLRPDGEPRQEAPETRYLSEMLTELQQMAEHRRSLLKDRDASAVAEHLQGMRAIALPPEVIDEQSLLPEPESTIDVVGVFPTYTPDELPEDKRGNIDRCVVMTLFQNVSVLQKHDDTVTVALTPQEAHLIELLPSSTKLNLVARNRKDADFATIRRQTSSKLLDDLQYYSIGPPPKVTQQDPYHCPPHQERNADGDCKPKIEIIR